MADADRLTEPPTLLTPRLRLRPFELVDAPLVEEYAGHADVAATTLTIPHPYPVGAAAAWIATHADQWQARRSAIYAVCNVSSGDLLGCVSLGLVPQHEHAELGYWLRVSDWGRGVTTEAAGALCEFGFDVLGLHRVQSRHFPRNPASGRVMRKLGMTLEGRLREAVRKNDVFEDVDVYSVLSREWRQREPGAPA